MATAPAVPKTKIAGGSFLLEERNLADVFTPEDFTDEHRQIARTTEETLRLVPGDLREASLALGIPRWRTVLSVVVPTASAGLITGAMLAVARMAGETAPLIFTTLGNM